MKIPIVSDRASEVRVGFRHMFQTNGGKIRPHTEATVGWTTRAGEERAFIGLAFIHPSDHPDKSVGRKLALARALWAAGFTRNERRQVWVGLLDKGMRV